MRVRSQKWDYEPDELWQGEVPKLELGRKVAFPSWSLGTRAEQGFKVNETGETPMPDKKGGVAQVGSQRNKKGRTHGSAPTVKGIGERSAHRLKPVPLTPAP